MLIKNSLGSAKVLAPIEIDHKALTEDGEFEGYASIFNIKDQGGDIVMPGAFAESLMARPAARVKMLWQHERDGPIGVWSIAREDARGLYVKGKLILAVEKGREAHELMKAGAIDGLSIGYRTIEDTWDRDQDARKLIKVDLKEISVVTFPMLETATVQLVKGDKLPTEREFETWLKRDAGFTVQQAKAIIAKGYKAIRPERDAGGSGDGLQEALQQLADTLRS